MLNLNLMNQGYSHQYGCAAVIIPDDASREDIDEIVEFAEEIGAIYSYGETDDDTELVVQLPQRGFIEVYTARALRGSLPRS
jgi:hypothetical protein